MGTLYLIDAHNPTLLSSAINDTIPVELGDAQVINGSFPVNVPFGVPIDGTPSSLSDLLTKKFAGLLAYYPGYLNITYDEGIDGSTWDVASPTTGVTVGDRATTSIFGDDLILQSNPVVIASAPSEAIMVWELFEITTTNDKDGVLIKEYKERDPSELTCRVSFDGGSFFTTFTDGVQTSIIPSYQGTNLVVRFQNSFPSDRLWIGSWALIY